GRDHRIRIEGEALDALLHQPAGKVWVVRRSLAANSHVLALLAAGADRHDEHRLHGGIALVEGLGDEARVAVEAERELREVIRADREAIEELEELFGQYGVGRQLAHHDYAQAVLAAFEAVLL